MRNRIKHHAAIGFLFIVLGLVSAVNGMAEELQVPQQVIQDVSEQLKSKLQDKAFTRDFAQVVAFVSSVISPHTDFDKIAPLVLGAHWKTAVPDERERFKQEFKTLLLRAYSRAFVEYNKWSITYQPLQMSNADTKVMVKTKVLQPSIQPVDVNYRMYLGKGQWKVYDIVIDGVSLVTNYRSTFNDEIQKQGSLNALIDTIAKRNTEALKAKDS